MFEPERTFDRDSQGTIQESPHRHAAMEWWFVQGWFHGDVRGRRHFMLAFFQQQQPRPAQEPLRGHTLLISHLDPTTGEHFYRSQVSPGVIDLLVHLHDKLKSANFEKYLVDTLIDEIKAYGPPHPVATEAAPVKTVAEHCAIGWADVAIQQSGRIFDVQYASPEDGQACCLVLTPCTERLFYEMNAGHDQTMAYASIPRMTVAGRVGQEAVSGEAWFDHQWGDYAWFASEGRDRRILGWDWFGINLEDGSDLLLIIHRNMQDQGILARHAIHVASDGVQRELGSFSARPRRIWESPRTLCRYPVAWQLELPEIDAALTLEPLADDQELPVFGVMRTVWEGACVVNGTQQGVPVSGQARLELHGYGYIFDFKDYLKRWVARIDKQIEKLLPPQMSAGALAYFVGPEHRYELPAQTTMLSTPVWDMLQRGGKRWRPIFGFLLLEALGRSYLPFEQLLATTIELSHLGSLMIDDIEDRSPLRRGEASIHLRYGTDVAINAGNTLYFLPFLLLEDHAHLSVSQRERIYQVMIRQFVHSHFGQAMDLYWSKYVSPEHLTAWLRDAMPEKILGMYAGKTAAPVIGLSQIACIIAEADEATIAASTQFARAFGVAFQVIDDVLNFSASDKWTKKAGEDLAAGKLTYVIAKALQRSRDDAYDRLHRLVCGNGVGCEPHDLEIGIRIVRESGVLEDCRDQARAMVKEGWTKFSQHLKPSDAKVMLRLLCTRLTDLTFST